MKIDNFVRIIDGKLQTTPPIDAFASICFDAPRIQHGDLFMDVTSSRELIQLALEKGAYAIVTSLAFEDEDDECAWIEISSMEQTLIKILRFTITQKSLNIMLLTSVQASYLEMIQTPKSIKYLQGSILSITRKILLAKEKESFCFNDHTLTQHIAPTYISAPAVPLQHKPIPKGLFLCSFWYQERYYHEQRIPVCFVEEFLTLLSFCDAQNITYSLEHLGFIDHFYPQFITHALCKKEFGSSDKVLIFEPIDTLIHTHLEYIHQHSDHSHIIVCVPKSFQLASCKDEVVYFDRPEDLFILHNKRFQYALILGDKENFEFLFAKTFTTQPSLF